ncbi:MAG: hypothetical protein QXT00_02485 [Ignisphaera sp.]
MRAQKGYIPAEVANKLIDEYVQLRAKGAHEFDARDAHRLHEIAKSLHKYAQEFLDLSQTVTEFLRAIEESIVYAVQDVESGDARRAETDLLCPKCLMKGNKRWLIVVRKGAGYDADYYLTCARKHYNEPYYGVLFELADDYLRACENENAREQISQMFYAHDFLKDAKRINIVRAALANGMFTEHWYNIQPYVDKLGDAIKEAQNAPEPRKTAEILIPALEALMQTIHGRGEIMELLLGDSAAALWKLKPAKKHNMLKAALLRAFRKYILGAQ